LSRGMAEEEGARVAVELAREGFDLGRGPLFRASLVRKEEREHVLVVAIHHIVTDGWSTGIMIKEMTGLYKAYCSGEEAELEELPVQYADYAHWQREWLQGAVLEEELRYWKRQLNEAPAVMELATDWARGAEQGNRGARVRGRLSAELSEGIKQLSRGEGVTQYMTLLSGFEALIYRYSGQEDVVLGTPVANRTRAEIEGLIGFFVNPLVLRVDLRGEPSFREVVKR